MELNCDELTTTEVNRKLRSLESGTEIVLRHPRGRHNLAIAVRTPVKVLLDGDVGYFCGGMNDGAAITVSGHADTGLGENQQAGSINVLKSVGACAGASMRGGTLIIHGNAGNRAGISMKGGTLIVGGRAGPMAGFMHQAGTIVVRGDVGRGVGDSMYEGVIFVGGRVAELGNDAVIEEPSEEEHAGLVAQLRQAGIDPEADWKKIVAGRQLWYFKGTKEELAVWMRM